MEIIKTSPSKPVKCEYGDFELRPEEGWKLSQTFIDDESKLLIVSVSLIDQSQWIRHSYGARTIPTREYKIDLKTLSILEPADWQKYFTYNKIEIISEDKRYKLISQRIFEPERNSDGYKEELYDLTSGKKISSGSSIAFHKEKRVNLLESHYRTLKAQEENQRLLDAKPTLQTFYIQQIEALKDGDRILIYHDSDHVFQLTYNDGTFLLSQSSKLPPNRSQWISMKFDTIKVYNSVDDFWNDLASDKKWHVKFKYIDEKTLPVKPLVLAKHINSFFNDIRSKHNFTYAEYNAINNWGIPVWSDQYKPTEVKQFCSNCLKEVDYYPRYPKYICSQCASKPKFDRKGNRVEFSNLGFSGGFKITYEDSNGKTIREDDTREYCECIIDEKRFFAKEAKFGGIVIQAKE